MGFTDIYRVGMKSTPKGLGFRVKNSLNGVRGLYRGALHGLIQGDTEFCYLNSMYLGPKVLIYSKHLGPNILSFEYLGP